MLLHRIFSCLYASSVRSRAGLSANRRVSQICAFTSRALLPICFSGWAFTSRALAHLLLGGRFASDWCRLLLSCGRLLLILLSCGPPHKFTSYCAVNPMHYDEGHSALGLSFDDYFSILSDYFSIAYGLLPFCSALLCASQLLFAMSWPFCSSFRGFYFPPMAILLLIYVPFRPKQKLLDKILLLNFAVSTSPCAGLLLKCVALLPQRAFTSRLLESLLGMKRFTSHICALTSLIVLKPGLT